MKEKILCLLKEAEGYISGEYMSQMLGVSRTAIWKTIKNIKLEGYVIESVTKKGYRLIKSPDTITPEEIQYHLATKTIGSKLMFFESVGSTNEEIKKLALQGENEGLVVIANQQVKGKGRRGRHWVSEPNTGIWLSLLLRPPINPNHASRITLVAGLAVCRAIRESTGQEVYIKWPNDIILNGKKICGILTEMSSELDYINYVVVGIGINVNIKTFPEEISNIATSLCIESKRLYKRADIVKGLLQHFEELYESYLETLDLSLFIDDYNQYCINVGREVKVINSEQTLVGQALNVTDTGELVIETNGQKEIIHAGEVSVRGIHGYV